MITGLDKKKIFYVILFIAVTVYIAAVSNFPVYAQEQTTTATTQAIKGDSGIYLESYEVDIRFESNSYLITDVLKITNNTGKESKDGFEMTLPEGASSVQPMQGLTQDQVKIDGRKLIISAPISTTQTTLIYSYTINSPEISPDFIVPFDTRNVDFFIETNIKAETTALIFEEKKTFENVDYNIYGKHNSVLSKGSKISLKLSPGGSSPLGGGGLNFQNILPYLIGLLIIGAIVLIYFGRRRNLYKYEYEDDDEHEEEEDDDKDYYDDEDDGKDYYDDEDEDEDYYDDEEEYEEEYENKEEEIDNLETEEDVYIELKDYLDELYEVGAIDQQIYKKVKRNLSRFSS